ncbi:IlvD/Edd family dehydratase [Streptomyces sp. 7-21]|jgi:dihydroxy-acid dehydratase|uniref:IlvD/Edd family dehydratase n=1 Tax=Streptomyces sp. 7-21 TaxID=2802283 RepID=UPI00191E7F71|nr:IlvD/Edd family dehydratase [Streptomyces sp. 7-21]MBL1066433.1 dihydroxy-acid dehydratase [Streptomyces sp. 7-21]
MTEQASGEKAPRRRSGAWFQAEGRNGFIHRSWMRNQGFEPEVFDGRPVVGIASTFSELTPCNAHLRDIAEAVKRGVWQAGGLPLEFPVMSLGETIMRPTTMLYRNLAAMEAEESMRANPLDAVVLLSGCDKTTPSLLMAATSVDIPAIMVTGGPMLNGKFQGRDIGSGTDVWRLHEEERAGKITAEDLAEAEVCMSRSRGHCMTMGTASTMACLAEALGFQLSGAAALPAVDARRYALAQLTGKRAVAMADSGPRPSEILTREAFENAIRVNAALGGSTNAVVHLLALARRAGVELSLDDFDALVADVPVLVDMMPSGRFLMEDFAYAGGLPVVLRELAEAGLLHTGARTVGGATIGEDVANARRYNDEVIRTVDNPVRPAGEGTVVLRGSLCPNGAVLKVSAASPSLLKHRGKALVFDRVEDYIAVADDPDLPVDASTVIVVRNAGPRGYPGFPEVGNPPVPKKLLQQGITDVVRISDARMSGTGYGTCVLHVAPEAAVGGPIALVRTGDWIELDVAARRLDLDVPEEELAARAKEFTPPKPPHDGRGWTRLYTEHVLQADEGADLDFLVGRSGNEVPRHSH